MNISLVKPTIKMKQAYMEFLKEWDDNNEEVIPYSARLIDMTYEQWLDYTNNLETLAPEGLVTAHTFLAINSSNKIIGAVNIRHKLNNYLLNYGGHIGYGICPSQRGKGYAKEILSKAIYISRDMGINDILLVCNKINIASSKTIIRNRGVLENEFCEDGNIIQRYWICND